MIFDVLLSRRKKIFRIYFIVKIYFLWNSVCQAYIVQRMSGLYYLLFIRIIDPMEGKLLYVFKEKIKQGSIGPHNSWDL
jgi:hypothetical protein